MEDPIKKAQRMVRFWQRRLDELTVNVNGVNAKKEKSERGKVPLEPPKGEKGKEKESSSSSSARPRARVSDEFLRKWNIPALFLSYWIEVTRNCEIHDAEQSIRNYWSHSEKDKAWYLFKHNRKTPLAPKAYPPDDWELCAERCANFKSGKCACGITTPPNCNSPRPFPPEECPRYARKTGMEGLTSYPTFGGVK